MIKNEYFPSLNNIRDGSVIVDKKDDYHRSNDLRISNNYNECNSFIKDQNMKL